MIKDSGLEANGNNISNCLLEHLCKFDDGLIITVVQCCCQIYISEIKTLLVYPIPPQQLQSCLPICWVRNMTYTITCKS